MKLEKIYYDPFVRVKHPFVVYLLSRFVQGGEYYQIYPFASIEYQFSHIFHDWYIEYLQSITPKILFKPNMQLGKVKDSHGPQMIHPKRKFIPNKQCSAFQRGARTH